MAETVEDMDSLDGKLFGNAFKRNPPDDGKKRITFADEDDPLTNLLIDKEDMPTSQKTPIAIRDKRSIIDDLFDKKFSNESLSSSKPDEKENNLTSVSSATEIDRSKALDDKVKKQSLMQDLFGNILHTSPSKESNISKRSMWPEEKISTTQYAEIPKTQSQHSTYALTSFGTRESRRGKKTSEIINDPLGLFSSTLSRTEHITNAAERRAVSADSNRQKSENKEYLPDWLEPKKTAENKNSDYIQDKPTEELFNRHRRSSSDKIIQEVANIQDNEYRTEALPEREKLTSDKSDKLSDDKKVEMNECEKQKNEENYPKDAHNNFIHKEIGYETAIQKLELEKSHLTVQIYSLNEKYENEIMILDDSYKRQIGFLQERTNTLEKRMQQELECLETDYETKIEKLKNEKLQIETFYKGEIQNMKKEHMQFIEEIYERHSQSTRLLQKEHFDTMENILKMREMENLAMTTIATHKTDLQNLLEKANFIIENIKNVQEKTDQRDDQSMKLKEYYLKNCEEDVQIRNIEMKKQQELLKQERDKMMKVADKLDSHVAQLVLELEKKSTMLNEALETLKRREEFLSHEREIFEEKVQWERNHLQTLKESWFNEQEKQLKALTKEKEIITAKKKQYEVLRTIKNNSDDITKVELTAAIKAAQDATIVANQERLKWQKKIKDLEIQQQTLQEKEFRLLARAQDLESFTQVAFAKNKEAVKVLKEARHIENEHRTKVDAHFGILTQTQNTTTEKLNLANEKLALRTAQMEKLGNNMNIPFSYANKQALSSQQHAFQVTTHFSDVVDPRLVMLKLNLDDQLDNVKYMTAMKL